MMDELEQAIAYWRKCRASLDVARAAVRDAELVRQGVADAEADAELAVWATVRRMVDPDGEVA